MSYYEQELLFNVAISCFRSPVLAVMAELYGLQPRLGYYLLYYLKCFNTPDNKYKSKAGLYKDLMLTIDENNMVDICLVNDMRQCQEDDVTLFVWLTPDIYTWFQKAAIGNVDLLYLVVSCVDGYQIQTLLCYIISRDFIMFKKDTVQNVINISLSWETFEQYALWQLLSGRVTLSTNSSRILGKIQSSTELFRTIENEIS